MVCEERGCFWSLSTMFCSSSVFVVGERSIKFIMFWWDTGIVEIHYFERVDQRHTDLFRLVNLAAFGGWKLSHFELNSKISKSKIPIPKKYLSRAFSEKVPENHLITPSPHFHKSVRDSYGCDSVAGENKL
jgi:hypothetical protein